MPAFRALFFGVIVLVSLSSNAVDWPWWRGRDLNNISAERLQLTPWPAEGPVVLWRTNVGTGFSSIAISKGRLYTTGNREESDTVYCLDALTGEVLWKHSYQEPLAPNLYEGGPSTTPTVLGGCVYTMSKSGRVLCLGADDGAVFWQRNLVQELGVRAPTWGFAGSPLLLGQGLALNVGGHGCVLNRIDGNLIWLSNTERGGYATPVLYNHEGRLVLLIFSYRTFAAASVDDGTLLWDLPWKTGYDTNTGDPIVRQGRIFLTSHDHASTMIEVRSNQISTNWQNSQLSVHLSPGVVLGDYLYTFHGLARYSDVLACLNLNTGELAWSVSGLRVGSLIAVKDKLLVLTGDGELILAEANPLAFTPLARAGILQGRCWTMPAFSQGRLYARNAAGDLVALVLPCSPEAEPPLEIVGTPDRSRTVVSWPEAAGGYHLQRRQLGSPGPDWADVAEEPILQAGQYVLTNDASGAGAAYRLIKR